MANYQIPFGSIFHFYKATPNMLNLHTPARLKESDELNIAGLLLRVVLIKASKKSEVVKNNTYYELKFEKV